MQQDAIRDGACFMRYTHTHTNARTHMLTLAHTNTYPYMRMVFMHRGVVCSSIRPIPTSARSHLGPFPLMPVPA